MSILSQVRKPVVKAPIITIVGEPGTGKTSLAATFPSPIILPFESVDAAFQDYTEDEAPAILPLIDNPNKQRGYSAYNQTRQVLIELYKEEHDFKTLIIDSVTAMNLKFEKEIAQNDNVDTVANAAGGFHKGYQVLKDYHLNVFEMCQKLSQHRNMTIIFLAHTGIEKRKNDPTETSEYTVNSLNMHADSAKVYVNESDAVLYIEQPKIIMGVQRDKKGNQTGTGRAVTQDKRQLVTSAEGMAGYGYAKNRFGMPPLLEVDYKENPIMQYIKFYGLTNTNTTEEV